MSPQIMGPQMDPNHLSCFIYNFSPHRIGYWKDPLIRPNPFPGYVFLETICNLLWDEDNLQFLSAFGGFESKLSIFDVIGCQFQDLADPHPTPSHQFKNQPIPGFDGVENDFIHYFLFEDSPPDGCRWAVQLLQHRGVTGASEVRIEILGNEVEEGSELGVSGAFG